MPDRPWAVDTSSYTHLARAGHDGLFARLAPSGVILVPTDVDAEIETGRSLYPGIPSVSASPWAQQIVLTDDEVLLQLLVKANMGGGPHEHLGECAVIASSSSRDYVAIIDEREAIAQADLFGVQSHDTLWIVIDAFKKLDDIDRASAEAIVDDLLSTAMYLPIASGASLFAWAYEQGLLP